MNSNSNKGALAHVKASFVAIKLFKLCANFSKEFLKITADCDINQINGLLKLCNTRISTIIKKKKKIN